MPLLTIFTPTYNRKHTLTRAYESLCSQTNYDFLWLIIDDGSTDGTKELVNSFLMKDNPFSIEYYYKENGGLHTGYNKAIEECKTDLMLCLDSDDYLPVDCVEKALRLWEEKKDKSLAGVIGLDYDLDGNVIGTRLPTQERINLIDAFVGKYNICGDKKYIVRTDLYKKVAPMPVFTGEKNFNPHYMVLKISFDYDFLVLNENLCFVDYQTDGMTANQWKQYYNSPNSFLETRKLFLQLPGATFGFKLKHSIHYISSCIFAKRKDWFSGSPTKFYTVLAMPLGILLSIVVWIKAR